MKRVELLLFDSAFGAMVYSRTHNCQIRMKMSDICLTSIIYQKNIRSLWHGFKSLGSITNYIRQNGNFKIVWGM